MRLTRARSLTPLLIGIALAALCIGIARPAAGVTEEAEIAALFREAEAHEAGGQWSLASSVYHKIMTEHPENALAHYRFGTIQDKLGASGLALKAYRDAARLDPDMKEAHQALEGHYLLLARTARAKGQRAETIEALQQAAEANPKSATAPLELGEELERQGSTEGALQAFQKATSADPDDVTARIKLGEALARRGMHERAASEFQQAVRLNPRNAEAHLGLGIAYAELGQRDKAAASLHQAMRFYVIAGDMEKGMQAEALEQKVKAGKSGGAPAPR